MGRITGAKGWMACALVLALIGWALPAQAGTPATASGVQATASGGNRPSGHHKPKKTAPGITISLHASGKGGAPARGQSGCSATITLQATVAYPSHISWAHDTLVYQPPRGVRVLNAPTPGHHHKQGKPAATPTAKPAGSGNTYGGSIQPHAKPKPPTKTHHPSTPPAVRFALPRPRHGHSTVLLKLSLAAAPVQVRDHHGRRHKQIGARLSGTLITMKGGKTVARLALHLLVTITCASRKAHPTPPAPATVTATIHNFAFNPSTLTIAAGTTVVWTNQDSVAHTVTAVDGSWTSGNLKQGQSYSHTFTNAGTFKYFCAVHPFMKGTVIVTAPAPTTVPGAPTATPQPPATVTPVPQGGPAPPPPPVPPAPQGVQVQATIHNFAFSPDPLVIAPGTTVIWTNLDTVAHTVSASDGSWGSGTLDQGASYSHAFTASGTYTYICQIHPFMHGTVIVGSAGSPPPPSPTSIPQPTATSIPAPTATSTTPPGVNTPTPGPVATATPTPGNAAVSIANFAFSPMTITVVPGTTVVWTNLDTVTHTVTADDNSWTSGSLNQGQSYSHTFTTPGTYTYHCAIHPFMHGAVIVGAPPPATKTPLPMATSTPTSAPTGAPTATRTAPAATSTMMPPTPTKTATPRPMATHTATATATHTAVPTAIHTATPTATTPAGVNTPTPKPTNTSTARPTATSTPRPTTQPTATHTPLPAPTATHTPLPVPTATKTPVATATPTHTPVPAPTATSTPQSGNVSVTIKNFAFHPMTITISAGTTVVWTNEDAVTHTATALDGSWGVSTMIGPGGMASHTFTAPSATPIEYFCEIHPFMKGWVIVKSSTQRPNTAQHNGTRHQGMRIRKTRHGV